MKPKIKVVGAEFERVIHAAPRSAHAPGLFLKPTHRSAPAPAIFDPLRSVFRSAHAPLTCSGCGQGRNVHVTAVTCRRDLVTAAVRTLLQFRKIFSTAATGK